MRCITRISGTLALAVLLVPTVDSQEQTARASCKGPYKGIHPDDRALQRIMDSPRTAGGRNLCGAVLVAARLSKANLSGVNLSEAILRGADLSGANLAEANLSLASLDAANLQGADLTGADLGQANLSLATLTGANLSRTNLRGAQLSAANLSGVDLSWAHLNGARLTKADLQGANLFYTDMTKTRLIGANLTKARFESTTLSGAELVGAKMMSATFEPLFPPNVVESAMHTAKDLSTLTFGGSPSGLVSIREGFKKSGLREQERQITYAIRHREASRSSWIEHGFNFVLFDLTCQYGMSPGRPLRILALLIFVFLVPYGIALQRHSGAGIWMIWSKERVLTSEGTDAPVRLESKGFRLLWTAFYFSLLSAFNIGWREINVGNWLSRLQSHEYTLRATGWVRSLSGIQSLLSVYLVALWVLTYFGRPFE
jgi:uncharacterized protein YjbI with pentapeptide repeats